MRAVGGSPRRCRARGIGRGDTVAVMAANTPEMVEAHFGVPMTGGVLNTLNTRLDADAIAFMLRHGEAKVLLTDCEFAPTVQARARAARRAATRDRHRATAKAPAASGWARCDYEAFIADGRPGVRVGSFRPTNGMPSR